MKQAARALGFTLVELLLATLLISFVGGVIYQLFAQGISLWHRSLVDRLDVDVLIYTERLAADLRNAILDTEGVFSGSTDSLDFATLSQVKSPSVSEKELNATAPSKVRYWYDQKKKKIYRGESGYLSYLRDQGQTMLGREIVPQVTNCKYSFYNPDSHAPNLWLNSWERDCLPPAVKVFIEYKNEAQVKNFSTVISLPHSACSVST